MERILNIYLHLPKCGGMSVTDALKAGLGEDRVQIFPNFAIDTEVKLKTRVVIGHLKFGCHKDVFPPVEDIRYLTMVREPVERLYSHWAYLQRQGRMELPIADFLESKRAIVDNLQVRMLTGRDWLEWAEIGEPITEKDLRQAKYNIAQHFDWVGVMDHFGASIARLSLYLKADLPALHHNKWNMREPIPPELAERARELNEYDAQLYQWVKETYYP
ncbi:MAG: hypothetical protein AMJ53_16695 [Gammaproteobacteria bacterium SG8_11]|nr:MAG: hypothetical protein AMJ53_16695 [Gammaproteobacteria bacterium SG8_11]